MLCVREARMQTAKKGLKVSGKNCKFFVATAKTKKLTTRVFDLRREFDRCEHRAIIVAAVNRFVAARENLIEAEEDEENRQEEFAARNRLHFERERCNLYWHNEKLDNAELEDNFAIIIIDMAMYNHAEITEKTNSIKTTFIIIVCYRYERR